MKWSKVPTYLFTPGKLIWKYPLDISGGGKINGTFVGWCKKKLKFSDKFFSLWWIHKFCFVRSFVCSLLQHFLSSEEMKALASRPKVKRWEKKKQKEEKKCRKKTITMNWNLHNNTNPKCFLFVQVTENCMFSIWSGY